LIKKCEYDICNYYIVIRALASEDAKEFYFVSSKPTLFVLYTPH